MDSQSSTRHPGGGRSPLSVHVVEAVAEREGIDPLELSPPLHDAVDTTALDALFAPTGSGRRTGGSVSFTYRGHRVRVETDGYVSVENETERASEVGSDPE